MIEGLAGLGHRARAAALRGAHSFAVPEAAPAAAWVAATSADPAITRAARGWEAAGASYHELVRLCARAASELEPAGEYREKTAGELEALLALWPHVLLLPTVEPLERRELIELRAWPVHPLGLVTGRAWADGREVGPSEYFHHDLDHARYKLREDLLARGVVIPDAYREGTTFDRQAGRHRAIVAAAHGRVGGEAWEDGPRAHALAQSLLRAIDRIADDEVRRAAELLLFEMVHEKSLPLEPAVLVRAVTGVAHVDKLARKLASGFYRDPALGGEVAAALGAGRAALAGALRA